MERANHPPAHTDWGPPLNGQPLHLSHAGPLIRIQEASLGTERVTTFLPALCITSRSNFMKSALPSPPNHSIRALSNPPSCNGRAHLAAACPWACPGPWRVSASGFALELGQSLGPSHTPLIPEDPKGDPSPCAGPACLDTCVYSSSLPTSGPLWSWGPVEHED